MKFCMIGARGHSYYAYQVLKNLPEVQLTAIAPLGDLRAASLIQATAPWNPRQYDDWRAMLDREQPALVCIDGPFEQHAEMAAEALRRGIHVFCEKPVATTFAQLEMLEAAWRASGRHIRSMVGLRYDAAFLHAYRLVQAGAIGKIKLVRTQKSYKLGKRPEFYKRRDTYGGTIPWVGSHAIDWILYYTGDAFECVTAYHDATDNFDHGDLEIAAHCLFRLRSGVIADAGIDFLRPATAATHGDDRVRLAGTRGVLEVLGGKVHLIDADGDRVLDPPPADRDVFGDFVHELADGRPSLVSDEETFALARAILLARESADTLTTLHF